MNSIQHDGKAHAFENSWLVVQAFDNKYHGYFTCAVTVDRISTRLHVANFVKDENNLFITVYVSQAYAKSGTTTQRFLCFLPPDVPNLFALVVL